MINAGFITRILQSNNIVTRKRTGNLSRSVQHTEWTQELIAYHLGDLQRKFGDGILTHGLVDNMDENHFWYDMDDAVVLARKGSDLIKYKDAFQGDKGMTMVFRVTGGVHAKLHDPFFIFENSMANYPIQRTPDNVPVCSYRTQRKA